MALLAMFLVPEVVVERHASCIATLIEFICYIDCVILATVIGIIPVVVLHVFDSI